MRKRSLLLCSLLLVVLAGCAQATRESIEETLELKIKMTMLEPGRVSISAGMHNPGKYDYPDNDDYTGTLTVLDGTGKLLNDGKVYGFSRLAAGETFYPYTYELPLEPGVYQVQFSALDKPQVEVQFEVVKKEGILYLSAPQEYIDPFTQYTLAQTP